jgi:hypothetical protein
MSLVSPTHFWLKVLTLDTPVLLFLEFFKKVNVTNGKGLLYGYIYIYILDTLVFKLFGYAFYFRCYFCFHKKLFFVRSFLTGNQLNGRQNVKCFCMHVRIKCADRKMRNPLTLKIISGNWALPFSCFKSQCINFYVLVINASSLCSDERWKCSAAHRQFWNRRPPPICPQ